MFSFVRRRNKKYFRGDLPINDSMYLIPPADRKKRTLLDASVTIEAAIILPVVLMAFIVITQYFRIMDVSRRMQGICESVCMQTCESMYCTGRDDLSESDPAGNGSDNLGELAVNVLSSLVLGEYAEGKVRAEVSDAALSDVSGIQTLFMVGDDIVTIQIDYTYKLPFVMFGLGDVRQTVVASRRVWIGKEDTSGSEEEGEEETDDPWVYLGHNRTVYHLTPDCTYLSNWNMQTASRESAIVMGYTYCDTCRRKGAAGGTVYIFPGGGKYHSSDSCPATGAYIEKVRLSEVAGMRCCSRCMRGQH